MSSSTPLPGPTREPKSQFLAGITESNDSKQAFDPRPYLILDAYTFDQDEKKGWRSVEASHGPVTAAKLIRLYLEQHPRKQLTPHEADLVDIMHFHVGQLLSVEGEDCYQDAISHFEQSHRVENPAWNAYVDGTIAFLRQDVELLERMIENLRQIEAIEGEGSTNLRFLESYVKHLEQDKVSYSDAYDNA